jgi:hypothetical protein
MALEKAMLIRLGDDEEVPDAETINGYRADEDGGDDENWLRVHFNPETLKTSISTNLKSSDRGSGRTTGQYIEKSESTLTLDLVFDTSTKAPDLYDEQGANGTVTRVLHSDVRRITRNIALFFLQTRDPLQASSDRPPPPSRCHFRWGSFGFTGMVANMNETLDYFSSDGVPLRATVSLTLKEDRFQFQTYDVANAQNNVRSALQATSQPQGQGSTGGETQAPSPQAMLPDLEDPENTAGQRNGAPGTTSAGGPSQPPSPVDTSF